MIAPVAFKLEFAGLTDVGRARSRNEDSFVFRDELGLALVCDGMGGHAGGDIASRTAAETVTDFVYEYEPDTDDDQTRDASDLDEDEPADETEMTVSDASDVGNNIGQSISTIRQAVQRANRELVMLNQERGYPEGRGMGTTVVGLWMIEGTDKVLVFHAGDSRLYRYRGGQFQQLTRDHSLYQAWLDSGAHGHAPQRNIIVRALGTMRDIEPEVSIQSVSDGDRFLLCSDGLTSMMSDEQIAEILANSENLEQTCRKLVEHANQAGGYDNVTVVVARSLPL